MPNESPNGGYGQTETASVDNMLPEFGDDASDGPAQPPSPAGPPADRGWWDVWVVLAVVLVPAVYWGFADLIWPEGVHRYRSVAAYETAQVSGLIGWAALTLYLIRRSGEPASRFGLGRPVWAFNLILAGAVFAATWKIGVVMAGSFAEPPPGLFPPPPVGVWEWLLTVIGCAAVGFTEELVWRGYLLTRIEAVTGSTGQALLITSALFGLAHLYQGPGGMATTAVWGLLFGGAYCWVRRLWPVAAAHGLYNLLLTAGY